MSGITVTESISLGYKQIEWHYTDQEILDLFPDNEVSMVNSLLRRAQAAEQQLAAVTAERDDAQHVLVRHGVVPGIGGTCRCEQCRNVAKAMVEAGFTFVTIKDRWWEK